MTRASTKSRIAQFFVTTLVVGATATAIASPALAAKLGDSCKLKDAYKIEKVGSTYIRCEIVKGTSIHSTNPKLAAKFAWTTSTEAQYVLANAHG